MTPIPSDVAAAIVAAGHDIEAEATIAAGYGRAVWTWTHGAAVAPAWIVRVGDLGYRGTRGSGRNVSARAATLNALGTLAAQGESLAAESDAEAKRRRIPGAKASHAAEAAAQRQRAADVRALAERVAAMWPEVSP